MARSGAPAGKKYPIQVRAKVQVWANLRASRQLSSERLYCPTLRRHDADWANDAQCDVHWGPQLCAPFNEAMIEGLAGADSHQLDRAHSGRRSHTVTCMNLSQFNEARTARVTVVTASATPSACSAWITARIGAGAG